MDQQGLERTIRDRMWQASHQQDKSVRTDGWQNPLPDSAKAWLMAAAAQFGVDEAQQQQFASTGLIRLDALHLILICQSEKPVPMWLAVGILPEPEALHPEVWQEALLRTNDVAMAMNGISLSLDPQGSALLTRPLAFDLPGQPDALAGVMNDFNSLASSLIDLLLSLGQPETTGAPEEAPPLPGWIAGWQQQLAERMDALSREALTTDWHYPLLQQTFTLLGLARESYLLEGCFCKLSFPERPLSVLADGDRRHLLISAPLDLEISPGDEQRHYLVANQELRLFTHCSLTLCGERICLVSRWDSLGLEAADLAGWLADFMTLTVAFDRRHQSAA
ncbi:hypothetical protein AAH450_12545 [Erwinia sp. P7711]|uniref:hypothetical protein n=1 Tax=Erwinia sp. P7711 TaxID=3141451 RepID=UPI003188269C